MQLYQAPKPGNIISPKLAHRRSSTGHADTAFRTKSFGPSCDRFSKITISKDIDIEDGLWDMVKARLPWLMIGVVGGVFSSLILKSNEDQIAVIPMLLFFVPLIAATAGNVGIQSSAIVVQALANGSMKGITSRNLWKEIAMAMVSGLVLSLAILAYNFIFNTEQTDYFLASISISIALFIIVVISATIGTLVPIVLNKRGIDPAIATGPFISTSNDLLGILIYFLVAKMVLGI